MAATTPLLLASIPPKASTFIKSISCSFPDAQVTAANYSRLVSPSPHSLRATFRTSVSAFAAIAFKPDQAPVSASPSKSLLFWVRHEYDLHRLEPGYPFIIDEINTPHETGCEAQSDGDVLLLCVVDAILGALGLPDTGKIFPDSDPKWKGVPPYRFCMVRQIVEFKFQNST